MENIQMPYVHLKAQQQKFKTEKHPKKENSCCSSITTNNKRPRMNWTEELHQRLLDIIEKSGSEKSVPRNVLELMNVPGLTRKQIADHLHKHRRNSKRKLNQQQKKPRATSPYLPLVKNHGKKYYWLAVKETPVHRYQRNENQLQFSKNSVDDTFEFGWEGIPDVIEGLDDFNAVGSYLYVEDSSGLCDLFRSYITQVRPHPQQFDSFDFGTVYK